ncbi:MAG TPA: cytochrome P450 [Ktedonosporobacter sp.]|nr:cytochrome P450 [Ktedonosporobacter sp.]
MATQIATRPIPTVKEAPFVGSLFEFNIHRLELFQRVAQECGDVGLLHFGPFPFLVFNAPEFVHRIFVENASDFDKGIFFHNAFRPVIGEGLFISEGDVHRRHRKMMAPSFQPRQIKNYADAMVQYSEQIQNTWQDEALIDIGKEMTHLTMSIVGKVLFDAEVMTEADELGSAMTVMLEHPNYMLSHLFPIPYSWPIPRHQRTRKAIAILKDKMWQMIKERRSSAEQKDDFLSILLQAREEDGSSMNDEQIYDEVITLFGAGHETTATALTWAWYLLAQHPESYHKVQQEVDSVLQGRSPVYDDLANLPYCLQVFKEAMRLYPPAYAISRVALHDMEIGGYQVKKDQSVIVLPYLLHRKPEYFPDPEKFDPERFIPENEKALPRYAYLPFGAGPRICIGNHFAMMEGHLLLATLAQRTTFDLLPGQHPLPDPMKTVTIRPNKPIRMAVRKRQ